MLLSCLNKKTDAFAFLVDRTSLSAIFCGKPYLRSSWTVLSFFFFFFLLCFFSFDNFIISDKNKKSSKKIKK